MFIYYNVDSKINLREYPQTKMGAMSSYLGGGGRNNFKTKNVCMLLDEKRIK